MSLHTPNHATLKTRGQCEAELANAVVNFYRTRLGRGPENARAYLIDDLVLVHQGGTLSPAETSLIQCPDGWDTIKRMRDQLAEIHQGEISELVCRIIGHRVRLHSSSTSRDGGRIDIFFLERPWDSPG